jgi:hypothetical protein
MTARIPPNLQRTVDAMVLAALNGGSPRPDGLDKVSVWAEDNPDESGFNSGVYDSFLALPRLSHIREAFFGDNLRDEANLSDDAAITDTERILFMRRVLIGVFEEGMGDADHEFSCSAVPLRSTSGHTAVLGYGVTGYSFTGVETRWFGLFTDTNAFRQSLIQLGWMTGIAEFDGLSSASKLELWHFD